MEDSTPQDSQRQTQRRAIEALRAGVPSRDAVRALGCRQPALEAHFRQRLNAAKEGAMEETQAAGMLLVGDFGAGKSHLLDAFRHLALEDNFVCGKGVISKETPLHDPAKLYLAAMQSSETPGRSGTAGTALTEVALKLDPTSEAYDHLAAWVRGMGTRLNSRFAATLFLFKDKMRDMALRNRILSFWAGDPLNVGEIRKVLKNCGARTTYPLETLGVQEMALQRFAFASHLILAAGYSGWVLLVDEVELIGRYSPLQRAKSYAQMARWAGKLPGQKYPGLVTVFALMSNFESEVLEEKGDLDTLPHKLKERGLVDMAKHAECGMRMIQREKVSLHPPDAEAIAQTRDQVRALYAEAYGWTPPDLESEESGRAPSSTAMRQHVRRWINAWDLRRLYPDYTPITETTAMTHDYTEAPDLEVASTDSDAAES